MKQFKILMPAKYTKKAKEQGFLNVKQFSYLFANFVGHR